MAIFDRTTSVLGPVKNIIPLWILLLNQILNLTCSSYEDEEEKSRWKNSNKKKQTKTNKEKEMFVWLEIINLNTKIIE